MTAWPSVAVVVTCFNYERYVRTAIDSILAQTRPVSEIVVVDDGSTDRSVETILSYGGSLIPVIQENAGQSAAKNTGYARTTADIILFLDADDALAPGAIEAILAVWTPTAAKVQFDLEIIDAEARPLGRRFCNYPAGYDAASVRNAFAGTGTYLWPVTSGNAYARAFLEQVMPATPRVPQDGFLNTIAPLFGDIVTVTEVLGQYRLHATNRSRVGSDGRNRSHPDFARRTALRVAEFDILREMAQARGVALPPGHLIDRELVFINYRLLALRLGQPYVGPGAHGTARLWWLGVCRALGEAVPAKSRLMNMAWLSIVAVSPRSVVQALVDARFDTTKRSWRAVLRSLVAR